MSIKVCHIISGDLWAGAEVMAWHLLSGLKSIPGIELFAIVLNTGILADKLKENGIVVHTLEETRQSFPAIVIRAAAMMRNLNPDIIHAHGYKEDILAYLVSLGMKNQTALVNTQHGMPEVKGDTNRPKQSLIAGINHHLQAHRFARTVAVSMDLKNALVRQFRFPEKIVAVIHNGIEVPPAATERNSRDTILIGSAGRLFPVKDYLLMVDIAQCVVLTTDRVRFELAGEGPLRKAVIKRIQMHELGKYFTLRGFVADMGAFYRNLDVYLNTSVHEGIPISVLEAMANGIPAVVPAVGGLPEIISDGKDGFLVESRDPEVYADRCSKLIKNESLRHKMGAAAREKILHEFSVQRMANDYAQMYAQVNGACRS